MRDGFFKFAFWFTFVCMLVTFWLPQRYVDQKGKRHKISHVSEKADIEGLTPSKPAIDSDFERVDIEKLKRLFDSGRLSDREALFYEKVMSDG